MNARATSTPRSNAAAKSPRVLASRAKRADPTAAMPIAVPMRWPVCNSPPAGPARRTGTSDRVRVWFGEMTSPDPKPATNSGPSVAQPVSCAGSGCTATSAPTKPRPTSTASDSP